MDIKNNIVFETEKDGNVFQFSMPIGTPYGQAYDVIIEALNEVQSMSVEHARKIKEQREQQKEEAEKQQEETGE